MNRRYFPFLALGILGAGWGFTMPMTRLAVSTGYQHFGLIAWQLILSCTLLTGVAKAQGKPLNFGRHHLKLLLVISLFGTIVPSSFAYIAAVHLPGGVLAIIISLVPMFALPIAIIWGLENFQPRRMVGIFLGAGAVVLLIGPEISLPGAGVAGFVLLAVIGPLCYGFEANFVAKFGLDGLDPVQALLGASVLGMCIIVPLTLTTGQWIDPFVPWGKAEWAILASGVLHAFCYTGYVWLVGRAGSVFASQVAYLVTGFGVFWSIVLLSESYSGWIWTALIVMILGLFLVRPKEDDGAAALELEAALRQDT